MRPQLPVAARARVPAALVLTFAMAMAACGDGGTGTPPDPEIAALTVQSGNGQAGTVGELLADSLAVRVTAAGGKAIPNAVVSWIVESGGGSITTTSTTNAGGTAKAAWRLGTTSGPAAVRAAAGAKSASFTATANAGPAVSVALNPATFTLDPGGQRQVQATAADSYGNAVAGGTFTWTSSSTPIATVDGAGVVRGVAGGTATIRATSGPRSGEASVTVTGPPPPLPTITGIGPAMLQPDSIATLTGSNFSGSPGSNVVTINGVAAAVLAQSPTQLQVRVPTLAALGCLPSGTVNVVVRVGTLSGTRPHPLRTSVSRALGTGELAGGPAGVFGCVELPAASGRYLISVYNGGPRATSGGFIVPGAGMRMLAAAPPSASPWEVGAAVADRVISPGLPAIRSARAERIAGLMRRHAQLLAQSAKVFADAGMQRTTPRAGVQASLVAAEPNVGDSIWIRYPNPNSPSSACTTFDSIRSRVAHKSARTIVLEDIAVPLPRAVDTLYAKLAADFDANQYPVVRDNFADPLLMDAELNGDGKLYMLFTKRVNDYGAAGFVWPGDIRPRTGPGSCPQSNLAEIFYGMVPTVASGGGSNDWTPDDWYWFTRSTVIHEVKHIASTTTRYRNLVPDEEAWLEEGTAMIAEEIWARRVFGYAHRGNVGFNESIACEFGIGSGCADKPLVMLNHFGFLYDYLTGPEPGNPAKGPEQYSLFGSTGTNEHTFYGSAWAFLRWALDQSTTSESTLLRALTQAATQGTTNLSGVLARPYPELLRDFGVAMALDDRPAVAPIDVRLTMPSWNMRDIFQGMTLLTSGGQPVFPGPYPLRPRTLGTTPIDIEQIRAGSAAFFELDLTQAGARAFQVVAPAGGTLSPNLSVMVIRIQ